MGFTIGFSAYKFSLKEPRGDEWTFGLGSPQDGYSRIRDFLRANEGKTLRLGERMGDNTYADHRAIRITNLRESRNERYLEGWVHKGEAGARRTIYEFDDSEGDPTYITAENEGVLTPMFFRFYIEDGKQYGVALFQTINSEGLKSYMEPAMQRHFRGLDSDSRLVFSLATLLDDRLLQKFAAAGLMHEVVLINKGQSADSRRSMERNTVAGESLSQGDRMELRLKKEWTPQVVKRLVAMVKKHRDVREAIKVSLDHYDDLQVELSLDGRRQKFSLLNQRDAPFKYVVSDHIRTDPRTGMPTFESLQAAAGNVWEQIQEILR